VNNERYCLTIDEDRLPAIRYIVHRVDGYGGQHASATDRCPPMTFRHWDNLHISSSWSYPILLGGSASRLQMTGPWHRRHTRVSSSSSPTPACIAKCALSRPNGTVAAAVQSVENSGRTARVRRNRRSGPAAHAVQHGRRIAISGWVSSVVTGAGSVTRARSPKSEEREREHSWLETPSRYAAPGPLDRPHPTPVVKPSYPGEQHRSSSTMPY